MPNRLLFVNDVGIEQASVRIRCPKKFVDRQEHDMLTVLVLLVVAAFIVTIAAAIGKAPLWVAVMLLCVIELLRVLPLGK